MSHVAISQEEQSLLSSFLESHPSAELVATYLLYIERKYNLHPVLLGKDKKIYQSASDVIELLEKEGKLWRQTEIKVTFSHQAVNEQTTKLYICPFSGKVFGNNTHPNPQDAIYDWVASCPENTERQGGLRVKRFYISEDPEVIQSYLAKNRPKEAIKKVVFSSVLNGKLFSSKESVIADFKKHYLKRISMSEVQNQNQYEIEEHFLHFIQEQLEEEKIIEFVEQLSQIEKFTPYVEKWLE